MLFAAVISCLTKVEQNSLCDGLSILFNMHIGILVISPVFGLLSFVLPFSATICVVIIADASLLYWVVIRKARLEKTCANVRVAS